MYIYLSACPTGALAEIYTPFLSQPCIFKVQGVLGSSTKGLA